MATILKGAAVVDAMKEKMLADVAELNARGVTPTLAILRLGERPDDISYEKGATKRCETVGVAIKNVVLPADATQEDMLKSVEALNKDASVHGVLLFLPMPKHIDEKAIRAALAPEKDVDGITDGSMAGVFTGNGKGYPPCTAQACMEILDFFKIDCTGKRAAVVGRSLVVGRPASIMLQQRNATVTMCHTKTVDMPSVVRNAEVVIVAAGKMRAINADYFAPGQIVIDVGINWDDAAGKLAGDVDFDAAEPIVDSITPVPGGVGTVTTSVLVSHVVEAAKKATL